MAELIDRREVLKNIASFAIGGDPQEEPMANVDHIGMSIEKLPTVTEAEIRNKAIEEFAERLNAKIEEVYSAPERESEYNHAWKTVCKIIQSNMEVIAEQLKGE